MTTDLAEILQSIKDSEAKLENKIHSKIDTFNERCDNHHKAIQWYVSLSLSLIVLATVITIMSSTFRH